MTTQTTPGADIDQRLARLEATLTLFIEEQREWRVKLAEDQRECHAKFAEDQREWRREFSAGLNRMEGRIDKLEGRIDKLDANINRLYFATFGVVGALTVAVIVASIFA